MSNVTDENIYGNCDCGCELEPVYFIEEETVIHRSTEIMYKTGRKRKNIDVLVCPCCFKEYCIDDSLAGPWYNE